MVGWHCRRQFKHGHFLNQLKFEFMGCFRFEYYKFWNHIIFISHLTMHEKYFNTIDELEPKFISYSLQSNSSIKWGQKYPPNQQTPIIPHHQNKEPIIESIQYDIQSESLSENEKNFKKDKINQFQTLGALKQEYAILKNFTINDNFRSASHEKLYYQEEDSFSSSSLSVSQQKNRFYASNKRGNNQDRTSKKERLQILASQSMKKLEQMYENQMQYKQIISEMARKLEKHEQNSMFYEKQDEKIHQNTLNFFKQEVQRLRQQNNEQRQRSQALEKEILQKKQILKEVESEKNSFQRQMMEYRHKAQDFQFQIKRLVMEKDLMIKQKSLMLKSYEKLLNGEDKSFQSLFKIQVIQLQEQNKHLKDQIVSLKRNQSKKVHQYSENLTLQLVLEEMKKMNENGEISADDVKSLERKLETMELGLEQKNQLEERIEFLEKIIDDENNEKVQFMEEVKAVTNDFATLSVQHKNLKEKYKILQQQQIKLKKELEDEKVKQTCSNDFKIMQLKFRVEELQRENEELKKQIGILQNKIVSLIQDEQERVKELEQQLNDYEYAIEKKQKENGLKIDFAEKKAKGEIQLARNNQERAEKERDEWQKEYERIKRYLQKNYSEIQNDIEKINKEYSEKLKEKDDERHNLNQKMTEQIKANNENHERQVKNLLEKLDFLTKSNDRYTNQNMEYMKMETQLFELRRKIKTQFGMTSTISHLWNVKEVEYEKIHEILHTLGKG